MIQQLRLRAPNAGGPIQSLVRELDPACMLQLRVCMPQLKDPMQQLKILHATTKILRATIKTRCSQINKQINKYLNKEEYQTLPIVSITLLYLDYYI